MRKRNKLVTLFVLLLAAILLLSSCTANALETAKRKKNTAAPALTAAPTETAAPAEETPTPVPELTPTPGPMDEAQRLADYLFEYGELPENFITKKEAQAMGWQDRYRYVGDIEPGLCIGGDYFGNYEQKLPVVKGRKYYEADCFYQGGPRNEYRIIYSTDGHVWFTGDHYETFVELYPTNAGREE